jgi:hypothetical protein
MNAFVKLHRNASSAMAQRNLLLSQPSSYFEGVFNGRVPSLPERLAWIELQVVQLLAWEIYSNDTYQVVVERNSSLIHMCIRRHDCQPCTDWKDRQQIKNELIGPEYEAVELFPAESRLIDTNNEYHLWVHPNLGFRFPFGFSSNRCVVQRPMMLGRESHAA